MEKDVRRIIKIEARTAKQMHAIKQRIHEQLAGNLDYVNSNIVLNGSDDRKEDGYEVHVYIFKECHYIPPITIY